MLQCCSAAAAAAGRTGFRGAAPELHIYHATRPDTWHTSCGRHATGTRGTPRAAPVHRAAPRHRTVAPCGCVPRPSAVLRQAAACFNSAQHGCATMQPALLQIRCCCPSRVATVLGRFVRRRNQHCRPSAAAAHRVLQRSLAGSCKDATETVAHPLQQRIGCCNSAQCDNAGLLHESAVCCNGAPHVETTDDSVAEQVDAQLVAARCNGAACCNACCSEVQPAVAQPNLLRKAHDNVMHTSAICCSRVATDHSPLQQTTAPVQPAAVSSTQRRQHVHSTGRACRNPAARPVAAHEDLLQR